MVEPINILVIENNNAYFLLIRNRLRHDGLDASCRQVLSQQGLLDALKNEHWDIVLIDYNLPGMAFSETLSTINRRFPDLPVILAFGTLDEEVAVNLLKDGVWDFIIKDHPARLVPAIKHALNDVQILRAKRQSEISYRELFDSINDAIYIQNKDGRLLDINQRAITMYGYPRDFFIGMSLEDFIATDRNDLQLIENAITDAFSGQPQHLEVWCKRASGEIFPADMHIMSTTYSGENAAIAVVRDITDFKAAENLKQQDREQQATLHSLLETTLGGGSQEETLSQCLKQLLAVSWLGSVSSGGVFLVDKDRRNLQLIATQNMDPEIQKVCARVPVGKCHCGLVASTCQMQYATCVGEYHKTDFPGMEDHGRYNIPLGSDGAVLGVLVIYLPVDSERDTLKEQFLDSASDILAEYLSRKQQEDRLRRASAVLECIHEGVMVTDLNSRAISINPAFTQLTGFTEPEVLGKKPEMLRSDHHDAGFYRELWRTVVNTGVWQGEIWNRRKNGEAYPEWITISTVRDENDKVINYVGVFKDIGQIKNAGERLSHLAHYDNLTDLPNRTLMQTLLKHALDRARREHHSVAVLFMDLDRFKNVNDSLGHAAGDELLKIVADHLRSRIRKSDTVSRLGGDEFVIILEGLKKIENAANVAQNIIEMLDMPIVLSTGQQVYVGASIGISIYPNDSESADQLIRNADSAMYQAKESGRNTYRFYTEELTLRAEARLYLEARLRVALDKGEMFLNYQLLIENAHYKGVEALLRWNDPDHGMISPLDFISIAEETRVIFTLGKWVLHTACAQMKSWLDVGVPLETMSVNISPIQLQQIDFVQLIQEVLIATGLPASHLELEITEGAIMEQSNEIEKKLAALHAMGIRLAIDDFGTGYSSLAYLKRFPIHTLKIDQSFVRDIPGSAASMEIAATIIAMARNLNLEVLAEGVENQEQLQFLQSKGCNIFQGYIFSRPVSADDITSMLSSDDYQQLLENLCAAVI